MSARQSPRTAGNDRLRATASACPKLDIIDWELVSRTDPNTLRKTKDPKTIEKLINTFMNANALFADPSFCPADMVLKLFSLMQIAVGDLIHDNQSLVEENSALRKKVRTLRTEKKEKKKAQTLAYNVPKVAFQCHFCPKMFQTREFLTAHVKRRHNDMTQSTPVEVNPHTQPIQRHVIETQQVARPSDNLGPFKAEVAAMIEHFDTMVRNEETKMRLDFSEQLRKLEKSVTLFMDKVRNGDFQSEGHRESGFSDASYSPARQSSSTRRSSTATHSTTRESSTAGEEEDEEETEYEYEEESVEEPPRQALPTITTQKSSEYTYAEEEEGYYITD